MKHLLLFIIIEFTSFLIASGLEYAESPGCGKGRNEVKILYKEDNEWKKIGSGDIIHPGAVLTFAQIVTNISKNNLQVVDNQSNEAGSIHKVAKIIRHPDYYPCNGSGNFAILILKTFFPVDNSPICLPTVEFVKKVNVNKDCFINGRIWSKYLMNSNQIEEECQKLPYLPRNIQQFLDDFSKCTLQNDQDSDIIMFSTTSKSECNFSEFGDGNFRKYLLGQHYSEIRCTKDDTGDYTDFNDNYYFYDILSWIEKILYQAFKDNINDSFI